jgi:hypothetical protein
MKFTYSWSHLPARVLMHWAGRGGRGQTALCSGDLGHVGEGLASGQPWGQGSTQLQLLPSQPRSRTPGLSENYPQVFYPTYYLLNAGVYITTSASASGELLNILPRLPPTFASTSPLNKPIESCYLEANPSLHPCLPRAGQVLPPNPPFCPSVIWTSNFREHGIFCTQCLVANST